MRKLDSLIAQAQGSAIGQLAQVPEVHEKLAGKLKNMSPESWGSALRSGLLVLATVGITVTASGDVFAQEDYEQQPQQESSFNLGTFVGGIVGGVLGNQIGGGTGQVISAIVGTVGGAIVGTKIDDAMDDAKEAKTGVRNMEAANKRQASASAQNAKKYQSIYPTSGNANGQMPNFTGACFAQWNGSVEPTASLSNNPQAKNAMDSAADYLKKTHTGYLKMGDKYAQLTENMNWSGSPKELEVNKRLRDAASPEMVEKEKAYIVGRGRFVEVCNLAAERGYDVSAYKEAINYFALATPSNKVYNSDEIYRDVHVQNNTQQQTQNRSNNPLTNIFKFR